jgi:hypothetical protein
VFSLKGNQVNLYDDVKIFFTSSLSPAVASVSYEGEQGRLEKGSIRATADSAWLQERHHWKSLHSMIAVTAKRAIDNRITEKIRSTSVVLRRMIRSD